MSVEQGHEGVELAVGECALVLADDDGVEGPAASRCQLWEDARSWNSVVDIRA